MVDFVNEPDAILAAFKTYDATAELAEATDPNLILDLKTKLDAQGPYDEFEIDRVVKVLLDGSRSDKARQSQLMGAIEPVAQRLLTLYKEARLAYRHAEEINDADTCLEKRAMFYKALLPLLDFEREVNSVDLSKVVLTHYHLREVGKRDLDLRQGDKPAIPGMARGVGVCRTRWSWRRSLPSSMICSTLN